MAAKTLDIMIQNVDIVYSDKVVRGNLGIRDGKIVPATGEAREVIDGTGLTALPGLLDIVGYKVGDEINFTYVEAAGSNVSPAYEILGEGGNAPALCVKCRFRVRPPARWNCWRNALRRWRKRQSWTWHFTALPDTTT